MSVKPHKGSRYRVHVKAKGPDGRIIEVRRVCPADGKRAAERMEREIRSLIARGEYREPGGAEPAEPERPPTLKEWVEVFLRDHSQAKGLSPGWIREQRRCLERDIVPTVGGDVPMDKIGPQTFVRLRAALGERGLAAKSRNNIANILTRAVGFYYETLGLDPPRFDRTRAKVPQSPPDFWELDDYALLLRAAAELGPEIEAIVLLTGDCGLRSGEVIALEWGDLRWNATPRPKIVIQRAYYRGEFGPPKSRRSRTVPMTDRVAAVLRTLRAKARVEGSTVMRAPWVLTRDGEAGTPTHLTRSGLSWRLCRAERGAGLQERHDDGQLHKLRHTYITRLAASGASAREVMELAGHTSLHTTLRYMHLVAGATDEAVARLEAFDRAQGTRSNGGATGPVEIRKTTFDGG